MKIVDQKVYEDWKNKNKDPYGAGCFAYAERWANMMELAMSQGEDIEDIAESTSFYADTEGITGFMYGVAASILYQCWEHGDKLKEALTKKPDPNNGRVVAVDFGK